MNNSAGSKTVNTAHKISWLCECIGQGQPPHLLHLIHSALCTPSPSTFLSSVFGYPLSSYLLYQLPFSLVPVLSFSITSIEHIQGLFFLFYFASFLDIFFFPLCQLSNSLFLLCSVSCYLPGALVFPVFSLISHQQFSLLL